MSATPTPGSGFGVVKIDARPKIAVTLKITEVKAKPENPDSDYDVIDVVCEPSRGSKKVFPMLLTRPEQFMPGFNPEAYTNYTANPDLANSKPGKSRSQGETFKIVFSNNIAPATTTPKSGKNMGVTRATKVTTLMAIMGGTLVGLDELAALRDAKVAAGGFEGKGSQVAAMINEFLKARTEVPEQLAIIKQSKDESGDLSDRYEIDSWLGELTDEAHEAVLARVEKNAENEDIGKRIQLGYGGKR